MNPILKSIQHRQDHIEEGDHYDFAVQALRDAGYSKVGDIAYPDELRGSVYRNEAGAYARVDRGELFGVFTNLEFSAKPFNCKLARSPGQPPRSPQNS